MEHVTVEELAKVLEGGADVDEVYSFAWLHYAALSASLAF